MSKLDCEEESRNEAMTRSDWRTDEGIRFTQADQSSLPGQVARKIVRNQPK